MDYEKNVGNEKWPHKLTFSGEEVKVMKASYTEMLVNRELNEQTQKTHRWERAMALFPSKRGPMVWNVGNLRTIANNLADFATATDTEIGEILDLPIPKFENAAVIKRRKYGEMAMTLACELRHIANLHEPVSEAEVQLFKARLDVMDDDDIRELWGPNSDEY